MADAPERKRPRGPRPLADIVGAALSPACRRRGFATADLVSHWPDIVGPSYALSTSPDRLSWPKKPKGVIDEDDHEPGTLTVRCSGAAALRFTHDAPQVIERINMFFGFRCVGRIKVLQLPVPRIERRARPKLAPVDPAVREAVATAASGIADDGLRAAVERLGLAVAARAKAPLTKS